MNRRAYPFIGESVRRALASRPTLLLGVAILLGGCGSNGGAKKDSPNTNGEAGAGAGAMMEPKCTATAEPGDLVQVPAGDFGMGCDPAADNACGDDEMPMHTVSISAFEIDRTEVTQAQYAACLAEGKCEAPSCDWNCDNQNFP